MSAITIAGDLVHYEKLGKGRPIILVHGWIGSWRYWIPLMQQLHLKNYTVYALDLLGFGDTSKNPKRYTVEEQARMLYQFVEQLGITKAAFLGHGLGAMVITEFALAYPERVARVLLSSVPLFDPGDLDSRNPAGTRVLLTSHRNRYSLAPDMPREDEMPASNLEATMMRRPTGNRASPNSAELPTMQQIDPRDRERLRERARLAANPVPETPASGRNHLMEVFRGRDFNSLLDRCFKRSEPEYEKIRLDFAKADPQTLQDSARLFDAGQMLDKLRLLESPLVLVHGRDDNLLPSPPGDNIWQYLSFQRDERFVAIPLSGVRHFPMLEYEPFPRLTLDFLEAADISKLEVRERWMRPHR